MNSRPEAGRGCAGRGPLAGLRVVVTRPREQAASLVSALEAAGAVAVQVPVIRIAEPADGGTGLRTALGSLAEDDWLVFTSPNGAARSGAELGGRPVPCRIAVIGPGTRAAAEQAGFRVDLEPDRSLAEGMLDALGDPSGSQRVVLARAEAGRDVLPAGLAAKGWAVEDVAAYRTVAAGISAAQAEDCRGADVVAFTSSSSVQHLVAAVGADGLPTVVAAIGPATSATAEALGVSVNVEASVHTIDGLVAAIVAHAEGQPRRIEG